MKTILTVKEVAESINVDDDFNPSLLEEYAKTATSFIKEKTDYDFAQDEEIEPLAKQCARLYVRQLHYGLSGGYKKESDYSYGINSFIIDLQNIAMCRKKESK